MLDVQSCKDINGNRVRIGDKVRFVDLVRNKKFPQIRTVKRIQKAGYFITMYVEEMDHPWHMPKLCAEKVIVEN